MTTAKKASVLDNPTVRLVIHAVVAGAVAAFAVYSTNPGDTHAIVLSFVGGIAGFFGYGVVSPTYHGVGVGK